MKLARLAGMVGIFGVVPVKFTKAAKFIQVGDRDEAGVTVILLEAPGAIVGFVGLDEVRIATGGVEDAGTLDTVDS